MSASALSTLSAHGVRLEIRDGTLTAGPREALTPEVRELIRAHKPELIAALSAASDPEPEPAHRLWLILHAPGDLRSHSFSPPATAAEIRRWYPDALLIEPEPDPEEAQP